MRSIKDLLHVISTKVRQRIFLRLGLTRRPRDKKSVISDLFVLRTGPDWQTNFELLNINALLLGGFDEGISSSVQMFFFSHNGELIQKLQIPVDSTPRTTINLSKLILNFPQEPATFAVFHSPTDSARVRGDSFLAERGYVGYEFKGLGTKGYVHGNLDAVAYCNDQIEPLGSGGLLRRNYTVQHLISNGAKYEFAFTNPTRRTQNIALEVSTEPNVWKKSSSIVLKPFGAGIMEVIGLTKPSVVRFRSKLYLARPIVFRTTEASMDVFHG